MLPYLDSEESYLPFFLCIIRPNGTAKICQHYTKLSRKQYTLSLLTRFLIKSVYIAKLAYFEGVRKYSLVDWLLRMPRLRPNIYIALGYSYTIP